MLVIYISPGHEEPEYRGDLGVRILCDLDTHGYEYGSSPDRINPSVRVLHHAGDLSDSGVAQVSAGAIIIGIAHKILGRDFTN